jgi:hypothetical protein
MNLPFTTEQFLSVFQQYNQAVWPLQVFFNLLALAAVALTIKTFSSSSKIISGILAFLWFWIGIAYHFAFFASINPGAYVFAVANILQGLLFLFYGVLRSQLRFSYRTNAYSIVGGVFILYALLAYPILGYHLGHVYPQSPTFGLPCPTTIFTLGLLLWTNARVPKQVLVIPFLWSVVGFSAAVNMGIREDTGLLVTGLVTTILIIIRDRSGNKPEAGFGHPEQRGM